LMPRAATPYTCLVISFFPGGVLASTGVVR
jgi:hypothetical protein